MEHSGVGDWMLPGAALVLIFIAGIVLVAFDDIVILVLRRRQRAQMERLHAAPSLATPGLSPRA